MQLKPTSQIKARLGIQPNGPAQKFLTNTCYRHMDKYVPMDTGNLRKNVSIEENSITYQSPYAHYQYNGKLYVDTKTKKGAFYSPDYGFWSRPNVPKEPTDIDLQYHTPGTGPHWDKRMKSAEIETVIQEVQNYVGGRR